MKKICNLVFHDEWDQMRRLFNCVVVSFNNFHFYAFLNCNDRHCKVKILHHFSHRAINLLNEMKSEKIFNSNPQRLYSLITGYFTFFLAPFIIFHSLYYHHRHHILVLLKFITRDVYSQQLHLNSTLHCYFTWLATTET
jgi:hypothetical protein